MPIGFSLQRRAHEHVLYRAVFEPVTAVYNVKTDAMLLYVYLIYCRLVTAFYCLKINVTCLSDYRRGLDWSIGFDHHLQVVSTDSSSLVSWGAVRLSTLNTLATNWSMVPPTDDR
jgi:hypothetical protein